MKRVNEANDHICVFSKWEKNKKLTSYNPYADNLNWNVSFGILGILSQTDDTAHISLHRILISVVRSQMIGIV